MAYDRDAASCSSAVHGGVVGLTERPRGTDEAPSEAGEHMLFTGPPPDHTHLPARFAS